MIGAGQGVEEEFSPLQPLVPRDHMLTSPELAGMS